MNTNVEMHLIQKQHDSLVNAYTKYQKFLPHLKCLRDFVIHHLSNRKFIWFLRTV